MSFIPTAIKTLESSSLTMDATTKTYTLTTPVHKDASVVMWLGTSQGDNNTDGSAHCVRVELGGLVGNNYTTVVAKTVTVAVTFLIVQFVVIQFTKPLVKSVQHFVTSAGASTQAITAVVLAKSILIYNGKTTTDTTANMQTLPNSLRFTSTTQVTLAQGAASISNFSVLEFK